MFIILLFVKEWKGKNRDYGKELGNLAIYQKLNCGYYLIKKNHGGIKNLIRQWFESILKNVHCRVHQTELD